MKPSTFVLALAGTAAAGAAIWHAQGSGAPKTSPPGDKPALPPLVLPGWRVQERVTGGADPAAALPLVLVLHGVGADEHQLESYTKTQEQARLIDMRGVLPSGSGFQWFHARFRGDVRRFMREVQDTAVKIVEALDLIAVQRPVTHNLVLGYSQGAHLAWWLATTGRFDRAIAVAGALPSGTRVPRYSGRVSIDGVHGTRDSVIPYSAGQETSRMYAEAGYPITWSPARFAGHSLLTIGPSIEPALRRALASLMS